jgi:hypothetical protein
MMKKPEHRRYIRYEALHLLDYLVIDSEGTPGPYSMGRTLDVSIDGIQLETREEIDRNSLLKITIGLQEDLIDIEGRTVHSSQSNGLHVAGVSFLKVSKEGRRILTKYIDAFNERQKEQEQ